MTEETTWIVISPDVWGHVGADCCAAYDCPCVDDGVGEGEPTHDDDACECHEECNNWFKVGKIEVPKDASGKAILDALAEGFLTRKGREECTLEDYANGCLDVHDGAGRLVLQLEIVEEEGGT
jgi:hypothetical protein